MDYMGIKLITATTLSDRWEFLMATFGSVLPNIENTEWEVLVNKDAITEKEDLDRIQLIEALASRSNCVVTFKCMGSEKSVGNMKATYWRETNSNAWYMNVDDDFIIPADTLRKIEEAVSVNDSLWPLTYGNNDLLNTRNYTDWSSEFHEGSELNKFIEQHSTRVVANHNWLGEGVLVETNFISAGFLIHREHLTEDVLDRIGSLPKGTRGYDVLLSEAVSGWRYIYGANAYHAGVLEPYMGKQWAEVDKSVDKVWDGKNSGVKK